MLFLTLCRNTKYMNELLALRLSEKIIEIMKYNIVQFIIKKTGTSWKHEGSERKQTQSHNVKQREGLKLVLLCNVI